MCTTCISMHTISVYFICLPKLCFTRISKSLSYFLHVFFKAVYNCMKRSVLFSNVLIIIFYEQAYWINI